MVLLYLSKIKVFEISLLNKYLAIVQLIKMYELIISSFIYKVFVISFNKSLRGRVVIGVSNIYLAERKSEDTHIKD